MRRINLLVLIFIFMIPFIYVEAATGARVLTLDADDSGLTITYNGTVEDGSHAVMCKLLNSNSEEIDLLSSAVLNNKFEGLFTVDSKATYKIACANYEGGEFKEVVVSFDDDMATSDATVKKVNKTDAKNVKTGDNIGKFMVLAVVSLVLIVTLFIIKKKRA